MCIINIIRFFKQLFSDTTTSNKLPTDRKILSVDVHRQSPLPQDSIDRRLLKPLEEGILPGDIILLMWSDKKASQMTPPLYFKYDYGIDAISHRQQLISAGYLKYADSYELVEALSVSQLKEILRKNNLPVSGRKKELINRIKEKAPDESYAENFSETFLVASSQGQQLLQKYENLVWAHKHNSKDGIVNVANALDQPQEKLQKQFKDSRNPVKLSKKALLELKENNQKQYQILSTLDKDTCYKCGLLDQNIFKTSNAELTVNIPPFHDGCRCTIMPYMTDLPDVGERWMRNPKTGKGEYTSIQTYSEWKKTMVQKYGKEVFD